MPRAQKWPENAKCPIVWGTPMDLSLDCGRSSVECETHQYNLHTIVETEVMGMYVKSLLYMLVVLVV